MASRLQSEIRQSKPFGSLRQEAVLQLARTSALMMHRWEQYLRPFGVTLTQYNVLRILRGAGACGLHRADVACRLITPVPDVSRLLDRMMRAGLLTRARGAEDRRTVHARITPRGLEILEKLDAPSAALPEQQLRQLSDDEVRQLIALLETARSAESPCAAKSQPSASQ